MWTIHGKKYDLTPFVQKHPGGAQILERALMMEDCGVMFETYHAFSNKEAIRNQLEKYLVIENEKSKNFNSLIPVYNFQEYEELTQRVKTLFPDRRSIKAPVLYYIKILFLLLLYITLFYISMCTNYNTFVRTVLAFISGILWVSLGFNIMHDGSHYGISRNPKINEFLESLWNSFGLWNSIIWNLHHVYGHHSYTGNIKLDPDMKHFRPFAKKYKEDIKGVKKYLTNIQDKIITFAACVFPGMYVGQSIAYLIGVLRNTLWGIRLPKNFMSKLKWHENFLMLLSFYCYWRGLFMPTVFYLLAANICYHLNIAGDHDTFESSVENRDENTKNWTKMQICHSANFKNNSSLWTNLFGGINYQIEHHLFPNMCHMNYPLIKPIVQKFCKEKEYPYVDHQNLWEMYLSFIKNIKFQSGDK